MSKVLVDRELLPCPFCGSQAELEDHRTIWAVRCVCGCCVLGERAPEPETDMPLEYWSHFEKSAIDAWNRRAQPAEAEGVRDYLAEFAEGEIEARTAIEELLAALSAVTAERDDLRMQVEALRKAAEPLEPVHGDQLPPIGSKVLIHLSRSDTWVEHTVVGYYVWGDLEGDEYLHRVFVRVRDSAGYLNARLLKDVRPVGAAMAAKEA